MTAETESAPEPGPTALNPDLVAALGRLAPTPRLLVALDFDGTLAPPADDPDDARSLPAARAAGLALADEPGVTVAVISGRAIDSLQRVTDAPDHVLFSGSHGAEYLIDGELSGPPLGDTAQLNLETIRGILNEVAQDAPGAWVEAKAYGYALHTRLAHTGDAARLEAAARERALALSGVTVREGKNVLEFSVVDATKANALERIRHITDATAMLFAGDDVTDEDGFAALHPGDVGVKVGAGATLAAHRVAGVEQMPTVLATLLRLRREHRPETR